MGLLDDLDNFDLSALEDLTDSTCRDDENEQPSSKAAFQPSQYMVLLCGKSANKNAVTRTSDKSRIIYCHVETDEEGSITGCANDKVYGSLLFGLNEFATLALIPRTKEAIPVVQISGLAKTDQDWNFMAQMRIFALSKQREPGDAPSLWDLVDFDVVELGNHLPPFYLHVIDDDVSRIKIMFRYIHVVYGPRLIVDNNNESSNSPAEKMKLIQDCKELTQSPAFLDALLFLYGTKKFLSEEFIIPLLEFSVIYNVPSVMQKIEKILLLDPPIKSKKLLSHLLLADKYRLKNLERKTLFRIEWHYQSIAIELINRDSSFKETLSQDMQNKVVDRICSGWAAWNTVQLAKTTPTNLRSRYLTSSSGGPMLEIDENGLQTLLDASSPIFNGKEDLALLAESHSN
ncbi:BTB/POZ domain containing protein [Ditylenchus destructor]|uniref:BTB/POZ domain containing protein n=1 Tax=Ditylenchus destructor TaxID=166010 RepID=A0AAD4NM69_9BILA|nr:BTB/POZ domain containing protein [Ditylenchus destructor]